MLLIDGYNLLFHAEYEEPHPEDTLAARRDRLIRTVARLATPQKRAVTIVFDGDQYESPGPSRERQGDITILMSPPGASADDVIVELVRQDPSWDVLTDDRELQSRVRRLGARAHQVTALARLLRLSRPAPRLPVEEEPPKPLPDPLSTDEWIEYLGFAPDELEVEIDSPTRDTDLPLDLTVDLSADSIEGWLRYFGLRPE